jgi:hypothetical protein
MKKIILLSCVVAGLISTSAIAVETAVKAVGGVTGAAIGAGVGAGVGALKAPSKGVNSALKCLDKTGMPVLCTTAGAIDTAASPVEGTVKGTAKGAAVGSGN